MKWAAGIIGIIGALLGLLLGFKWLSDLNSEFGQMVSAMTAAAGEAGKQLSNIKAATYALLICGFVGLIISVLILKRKFNRWANAGLLIVCGGLPLVFATDAIFGTPMILAGLLAFAVKYDSAAAPASPSA